MAEVLKHTNAHTVQSQKFKMTTSKPSDQTVTVSYNPAFESNIQENPFYQKLKMRQLYAQGILPREKSVGTTTFYYNTSYSSSAIEEGKVGPDDFGRRISGEQPNLDKITQADAAEVDTFEAATQTLPPPNLSSSIRTRTPKSSRNTINQTSNLSSSFNNKPVSGPGSLTGSYFSSSNDKNLIPQPMHQKSPRQQSTQNINITLNKTNIEKQTSTSTRTSTANAKLKRSSETTANPPKILRGIDSGQQNSQKQTSSSISSQSTSFVKSSVSNGVADGYVTGKRMDGPAASPIIKRNTNSNSNVSSSTNSTSALRAKSTIASFNNAHPQAPQQQKILSPSKQRIIEPTLPKQRDSEPQNTTISPSKLRNQSPRKNIKQTNVNYEQMMNPIIIADNDSRKLIYSPSRKSYNTVPSSVNTPQQKKELQKSIKAQIMRIENQNKLKTWMENNKHLIDSLPPTNKKPEKESSDEEIEESIDEDSINGKLPQESISFDGNKSMEDEIEDEIIESEKKKHLDLFSRKTDEISKKPQEVGGNKPQLTQKTITEQKEPTSDDKKPPISKKFGFRKSGLLTMGMENKANDPNIVPSPRSSVSSDDTASFDELAELERKIQVEHEELLKMGVVFDRTKFENEGMKENIALIEIENEESDEDDENEDEELENQSKTKRKLQLEDKDIEKIQKKVSESSDLLLKANQNTTMAASTSLEVSGSVPSHLADSSSNSLPSKGVSLVSENTSSSSDQLKGSKSNLESGSSAISKVNSILNTKKQIVKDFLKENNHELGVLDKTTEISDSSSLEISFTSRDEGLSSARDLESKKPKNVSKFDVQLDIDDEKNGNFNYNEAPSVTNLTNTSYSSEEEEEEEEEVFGKDLDDEKKVKTPDSEIDSSSDEENDKKKPKTSQIKKIKTKTKTKPKQKDVISSKKQPQTLISAFEQTSAKNFNKIPVSTSQIVSKTPKKPVLIPKETKVLIEKKKKPNLRDSTFEEMPKNDEKKHKTPNKKQEDTNPSSLESSFDSNSNISRETNEETPESKESTPESHKFLKQKPKKPVISSKSTPLKQKTTTIIKKPTNSSKKNPKTESSSTTQSYLNTLEGIKKKYGKIIKDFDKNLPSTTSSSSSTSFSPLSTTTADSSVAMIDQDLNLHKFVMHSLKPEDESSSLNESTTTTSDSNSQANVKEIPQIPPPPPYLSSSSSSSSNDPKTEFFVAASLAGLVAVTKGDSSSSASESFMSQYEKTRINDIISKYS